MAGSTTMDKLRFGVQTVAMVALLCCGAGNALAGDWATFAVIVFAATVLTW
jgi:hypothetical protein